MKSPKPDSDPLPNPRHEAFAREVASGKNAAAAYATVYGTKNRHAASTAGYRLLHRPGVASRIKSVQQAAAQGVALDLREIHHFLARVVRTPAGAVTPSSDLCVRVKIGSAGKETQMPSKLACVQMSAKLQGFFPRQAKPEVPSPQIPDEPRVLTGERGAVVMAAKRAPVLAELREAKEQRLPEANGQALPPPFEAVPRRDQQSPQISRVKAPKNSEMTNKNQRAREASANAGESPVGAIRRFSPAIAGPTASPRGGVGSRHGVESRNCGIAMNL